MNFISTIAATFRRPVSRPVASPVKPIPQSRKVGRKSSFVEWVEPTPTAPISAREVGKRPSRFQAMEKAAESLRQERESAPKGFVHVSYTRSEWDAIDAGWV